LKPAAYVQGLNAHQFKQLREQVLAIDFIQNGGQAQAAEPVEDAPEEVNVVSKTGAAVKSRAAHSTQLLSSKASPSRVSRRSGGGKVRRNSSYAPKQWCKTERSAAMRWAPGAQFFGPATGVLHHRRTGIGVARRRSSGGSLVPLVGGGALRAGCPPKAVGRRGAASAQYAQTQTQRSAKKEDAVATWPQL
jgi:hypothetical protein